MGHKTSITISASEFMNNRYLCRLEEHPPGSWIIKSLPHSKQPDGISCGVYVIKFAENYLLGKHFVFDWTMADIEKERKRNACRLLSAGIEVSVEETSVNQHDLNNSSLTQTEDTCVTQNYAVSLTSTVTEDTPVMKHNVGDKMDANIEFDEISVTEINLEHIPSKVKAYQLRGPCAKRKRSSVVYPSIKKGKRRLYCVCQQPYDRRRFMIFCNQCTDWFHLECLDMSKTDVPKKRGKFFCTKSGSLVEKEVEKMIDYQYISSMIDQIKKHAEGIMLCSQTECCDCTHNMHHRFLKDVPTFCIENSKKHLYASEYFELDTIEKLTKELQTIYLYKMKDPKYPVTGMPIDMIRGIQTSCPLYKCRKAYKMSGFHYIVHVLCKDVLAFVLARKTGIAIEFAYERCIATEVTSKVVRTDICN